MSVDVSEAQISELRASGLFDEQRYLEQYSDVKLLGMDPAKHYLWLGAKLGRRPSAASLVSRMIRRRRGARSTFFLSPIEEPLHDDGYSITRLMSHVWQLRADLRNVFDLHSRHSRLEFCKWFLLNASNEYALPDVVYSEELLLKLASTEGPAAAKAQAILDERKKLGSVLAPTPDDRTTEPEFVQDVRDDGVNLIGYAHGEFGMGEHARGTARALNAVKSPFSIIDFSKVGRHGLGDDSAQHWISKTKKYSINIFCINADTLPISYFSLGRSFFSNCYNIGYWAWELSKCPPEFDLSLATQLAGADLLDWHDAEIDIRHNDQH